VTSRAVLGVALLIGATAAAPAAEDTTLLLRAHPTDVAWGEIVLAEGGPVRVTLEDGEKIDTPVAPSTLPLSLAIACTERERKEDPGAKAPATTAPKERRIGAVYLAARVEGTREPWDAFVGRLRDRISTLTPETFVVFARDLANAISRRSPDLDAEFDLALCASAENQKDQFLRVKRRKQANGGIATSVTDLRDSARSCGQLQSGLEGVAEWGAPFVTRFDVRAQIEESLVLRSVTQLDSEPAEWPANGRVTREKPPEDGSGYSMINTNGGATDHEETRKDEKGPYVMKAHAEPAPIAASVLQGRSILTRWTWQVRSFRLGTEPAVLSDETRALDVAWMFPAPVSRVDFSAFSKNVVHEFVESSEPPGVDLLARLFQSHAKELGTDAAYTVACDTAAPEQATYCIAKACARITNPRDVCGSLASSLE
jgi:hypothetical protein